jgi:hypothetical protein
MDGGIVSAERTSDVHGQPVHDDVAFSIELFESGGELAARITNRWRFVR